MSNLVKNGIFCSIPQGIIMSKFGKFYIFFNFLEEAKYKISVKMEIFRSMPQGIEILNFGKKKKLNSLWNLNVKFGEKNGNFLFNSLGN